MTAKVYALSPRAERSTRDCLDPWFFAMVTSSREVKPCCWGPPVGVLSDGVSLSALLDGPEIRELRRQLLAGELAQACITCPNRTLTDPDTLRRRVRAELKQAVVDQPPARA
jgi:hypothetical protein